MEGEKTLIRRLILSSVSSNVPRASTFLCVFSGASLMRTVAGDKKYINGSSSGGFSAAFLE